ILSNLRNGAYLAISSHGTRVVEVRISSGMAASGMRLRNTRLAAPISPLKANNMLNCQGCGSSPRQNAAMTNVIKLAELAQAASRTRYRPRNDSGTSAVIHGSHAQLEMLLERLKQNNSINSSDSRLIAARKSPASGTSAMPKMNITRVAQPP